MAPGDYLGRRPDARSLTAEALLPTAAARLPSLRIGSTQTGHAVEVSVVADDRGDSPLLHVGDGERVFEVHGRIRRVEIECLQADAFLRELEAAKRQDRQKPSSNLLVAQTIR